MIAGEDSPVGLVVDTRYSIDERIARGGMGEIFRARDLRLNRPVALKVLHPSLSTPEWLARFEMEARTMSRIEHPGIVPIHDLGRFPDGRLYFTMKYIQGETLHQWIARKEDRNRLVRILATACEIVHYAHERGVIHRDLKPSNIMIDAHEQVYVLDWGIARVGEELVRTKAESPTTPAGLTSPGVVLGTLEFMSPEQARGEVSRLGPRTDVYSLGAILYEILTGVPPVTGPDPTALLAAAQKASPPAPSRRNSSVPRDLEAICLRALAANPDDRYSTSRDLAEDLRRYLSGNLTLARPAGLLERTWRWIAKHRAVALAVAVATGAGAWGVASAVRKSPPAAANLREKEAAARFEAARPGLIQAMLYARRKDAGFSELTQKVDKAQALIEQGLALAPNHPLGHFLLGQAWDLKGWDDRAEACWRKAIELDPKFGPAHYLLGRSLLARSYLESVLPGCDVPAPASPEIRRLAEEAARSIEAARTSPIGIDLEVDRIVAAAMIAYLAQKSSDVLKITEEGIRASGNQEGVEYLHWLKGLVLSGEERRKSFDRAIGLQPRFHLALISRADEKLTVKPDLRGALEDCAEALALRPRFAIAYLDRGFALSELGKQDEAIAAYTEALRLEPRFAKAFSNRAVSRIAKKDFDGAFDDCSQAIEIDPEFAGAYYNRAIARFGKDDVKGAIADYSVAVDLCPAYFEAWFNRAVLRERIEDWPGALADFTEAVNLKPGDSLCWSSRARVRTKLNQTEAAMADCTESLRLNSKDTMALLVRGTLYFCRNEIEAAIHDWEYSLEVAPADWIERPRVEQNLKMARERKEGGQRP